MSEFRLRHGFSARMQLAGDFAVKDKIGIRRKDCRGLCPVIPRKPRPQRVRR